MPLLLVLVLVLLEARYRLIMPLFTGLGCGLNRLFTVLAALFLQIHAGLYKKKYGWLKGFHSWLLFLYVVRWHIVNTMLDY